MPWNHVLLVQVRYEVNNKWCQWWKYMYRYLLYDKKIWLNTRSNFVDNKHFSTSPRQNPESFKCNFNRFKTCNLKKIKNWGRGRFRRSGGDHHQLYFFYKALYSFFGQISLRFVAFLRMYPPKTPSFILGPARVVAVSSDFGLHFR